MKKAILSILAIVTMTLGLNAQIPTAGLVGQYDFSNGALTDDINSANFTKTGTASTNIPDRFGNANAAISLNGDDLTRSDIDFNLVGGTGPFLSRTICFWMKTATNDANTRIIYNDNDRTSVSDVQFDGLTVHLENGQISAALRDNQFLGNYITHTEDVSDNAWHHIAVHAQVTSLSGTQRIVVYVFVDGVKEGGTTLVTSTMPGYAPNHTGNISFSRLKGASVSSSDKYEDGLDEVLIYTRILSDSEVNAIATAPECLVNIPDVNFKAYLVGNTAINTNGDTEIQCSEATAYSGNIISNSLSIIDMSGIEAFTNIVALSCANNQLTSLNVSANTALTVVSCDDNQITSLDLSNNTLLESLSCDNNQITSLDLSNNTMLESVECYNNQLTTLIVSNNPDLEELACYNNSLTSLDLSSTSSLTTLSCGDNQLTSLNLANGNNTNMDGGANASVWVLNNPSLTCIEIDAGYTPNSFDWRVDATASYSTDCTPCTVNIPDANFKAYLLGNTAININGNSEIECSEASNYIGQINAGGLFITDLTGIEAFTGVLELNCNNNSLASLDVSQNTNLLTLRSGNNSLTNLDLSQNTALTYLETNNNSLTNLDVSNNTALTDIYCVNNGLGSLDVSQNINLWKLNCNDNSLTNLDITQNPDLYYLYCADNSLTSIDVSQNLDLGRLDCNSNSIANIDISQNLDLNRFDCRNNNINEIDISLNGAIQLFNCSANSLTSLNVANGNNSNFTLFNASFNPNLTCIEVDDIAYSDANWTNIDAASSFSTNCNTTVLVSSITVQGQGGANTIATLGGTLQMEATILPANADDMTFTWSVSNGTGSGSIDANGVLTAITDGIMNVVATANDGSGVYGTATIGISNQNPTILVNSITVQGQGGASTITTNGGTLQMEATVLPANADDATYTWSVTNGTGSATIDANGLLTATGNGTVTVTATANDGSGETATFEVTISNQGVGIKDIAFDNLNVYPNPTTGIVNIAVGNEKITSIKVIDLAGRVIKQYGNESQINISDITNGIYLLEIANEEKRSIVKLIKK